MDASTRTAPFLRQVRGSEQIAAALRDVDFPISKPELIARLSDRWLDVDGDFLAPISDIVRGVPVKSFADAEQAQHAVDARWARIARAIAAVDEGERRTKP